MSYLWERGIKLHRNTTGFTPSRPYWRFPKDLLLLVPMKKQGGASGFALVAPPRNLNLAVCAQLWAVSSTIVSFQTHKEATKSRRGSTFRRELQRASSRQGEKLEKDFLNFLTYLGYEAPPCPPCRIGAVFQGVQIPCCLFLCTHTQITSQPQHEEQPDGTLVLTPTQVTSKRPWFAAQL